VSAFAPLFAEAAAHAARRLASRADGEVADMAEEATRATLAVIDRALFSGEAGMDFDETSTLVRTFMADRPRSPWG
jgi:cytochrome P450